MPRVRTVSDEDILDAAERVVHRVGPIRVTLADIGAEAGLSPAALIQRFGTKRELLLAMVARGVGGVRARFEKAAVAPGDRLDALVEAFVSGAAAIAGPEAYANALSFLHVDVTEPDFREHTRAWFAAMHEGSRRVLEQAERAGEIKRGDLDAIARALVVAYNGALLLWAVEREGAPMDAVRLAVETVLEPHRKDGALGQVRRNVPPR